MLDYNECEICLENYIDDICFCRIINEKEMYVCEGCLKSMINNNQIKISGKDIDYGEKYKYTIKGLKEKIINIDSKEEAEKWD